MTVKPLYWRVFCCVGLSVLSACHYLPQDGFLRNREKDYLRETVQQDTALRVPKGLATPKVDPLMHTPPGKIALAPVSSVNMMPPNYAAMSEQEDAEIQIASLKTQLAELKADQSRESAAKAAVIESQPMSARLSFTPDGAGLLTLEGVRLKPAYERIGKLLRKSSFDIVRHDDKEHLYVVKSPEGEPAELLVYVMPQKLSLQVSIFDTSGKLVLGHAAKILLEMIKAGFE